MSGQVVATGLWVPEGPTLLPGGEIAFVEQEASRVSLFDGDVVREIATAPGAWNAVTLGADGDLYAAQNGGVVGSWRSAIPGVPGIERIGLDGTVASVASVIGGVEAAAPNDLAFGPDGRLFFTDPASAYDPAARGDGGRLFVLGPDGGEVLVELGPVYCNGIGFLGDGTLVWAESYERHICTLTDDRRREVLCQLPKGEVPDGLAAATDGRIFVATVTSHAITVLAPDGTHLGYLALDDDAVPTNCCFDGSVLWVTDFGPGYLDGDTHNGRLWRLDTDAVGLPLHLGAL